MTPDDEIDIEERACIMEFDGGVTRLEAVKLAREAWHRDRFTRRIAALKRSLKEPPA